MTLKVKKGYIDEFDIKILSQFLTSGYDQNKAEMYEHSLVLSQRLSEVLLVK